MTEPEWQDLKTSPTGFGEREIATAIFLTAKKPEPFQEAGNAFFAELVTIHTLLAKIFAIIEVTP